MLKVNPQVFWNDLPLVLEVLDYDWREGTQEVNGMFKTASFNDVTGFPASYKNLVNYFKQEFDCFDFQLFTSLSETEGMGWHTDPDNVLIFGLFGDLYYELFSPEHRIKLKAGELLFIPKNKLHLGKSRELPRIILSMATPQELKPEQVNHHYNVVTGDLCH